MLNETDTARDPREAGPCGGGMTGDDGTGPQAMRSLMQLLEIQRDLAVEQLRCGDLSEYLETLLASAVRLPGFDCGGVYLCDGQSGSMELIAHRGLSETFVKQVRHYSGDSPQACLVSSGQLVYRGRADLPPELAASLEAEGLHLLAMIPIRDQDRVVAALNVSSHGHALLDNASRIALETLAAQAEGTIALIRTREARRGAERQLRLAMEGAELGSWVADFDSGNFNASELAGSLHGLASGLSLNVESAMDPVHPDDRAMVEAALKRSIEHGDPFSCEYRIWLPGREGRWLSSRARFFDDHGHRRLYGIVREITDRKKSEAALVEARDSLERRVAERTAELEAANAALREQTTRLELALDASKGGVSSWEIGSETLDWDHRVRELYGLEKDVPVTFDDLMRRLHPDDRKALLKDVAVIDAPGFGDHWNHEFRIVHPVLGERWIGRLGKVERDAEGRARRVLGISFDITGRKEIEESLRRSEQTMRDWNQALERRVAGRTAELNRTEARFRQLAEATFEGISISEEGVLIDCNPQLARINGYEIQEMIGRPILDFIAPESVEFVKARLDDPQETNYEFVGLRKDGTRFPGECHASMRSWQGRQTRVSAVRDLTNVKQAAARIQAQQTELAQAQRLALVSEVSAGIVHQMGQPLSAIGLNIAAALAGSNTCGSSQCPNLKVLAELQADVGRMRDTVTHLKALADVEKPVRSSTGFNELVERLLPLLREEASRHQTELVFHPERHLPAVAADAVQFSQVILNLARNAFEACGDQADGRRLVCLTTCLTGDGAVELKVIDSGAGIADRVRARMFEPFLTTKPDGLGIGLRLSRTIVHAHGGKISGCNNTGAPGATFSVILPAEAEC
jgi:PAS domain S-box-containing protein